jgi:hypothetical protein
MQICIVSGTTNRRFRSDINHRIYADLHGYDYVFDTGPVSTLQNAYFLKIQAMQRVLHQYDWVFWIDDDAFFTNFDRRLESFVEGIQRESFLLICQGLVLNRRGQFAFLNSGVFLLKNCGESTRFLELVNRVPLTAVKAWWNARKFGVFTSGDQDAITYVLHEHSLISKTSMLPYNAFNNRPYHYCDSPGEHFVVHFRVGQKPAAILEFARKFGLDEASLLPQSVLQIHQARNQAPL